MPTKLCPVCNETKDWSEFYIRKSGKLINTPSSYCKLCTNIVTNHKDINTPINKSCPRWLGEHVAEQILAKSFKNVIRMPKNNPGFDFICGKGKRIDVKSSCLRSNKCLTKHWTFLIKKNQIAEYFLLLGFDNREDLNPLHVWLVPAEVINNKSAIEISSSDKILKKWSQFEQSLDKVLECCNAMKIK